MTKRILIVEDEPTLLFALHDYLDQRGYAVDTASEPDQARRLLEGPPYDVVITDLRLTAAHEAEGLHVIATVRERDHSSHVVVLTGCATPATESAARRLGIDCFLHKPVPLSVVAGTVSQLVGE